MTIKNHNTIGEQKIQLLADDPVRPHITRDQRMGQNRDILFAVDDHDQVQAITCVSYQDQIPSQESELFQYSAEPQVAIFYTIWSYFPGSGSECLARALEYIKQAIPTIQRFVTLSPKTEMARKFHIKNGAVIFRENESSVNYEYQKHCI